MPGPDAVRLPLLAFLAVVAIVVLIARVRLHAFLSITVVSLALGLFAGMGIGLWFAAALLWFSWFARSRGWLGQVSPVAQG